MNMNGILGGLFFALANHLIGAYIWSDIKTDILKHRCVAANPTVDVGEIKKYCDERLYLKASE